MTRSHPTLRARAVAVALAAVTTALGAVALTSSGAATADASLTAVPAPPAAPTSADQIQNIDQVRTAIKAYYGDTPAPATDPVTGQPTTLHYASPTSAYADELAGIEAAATTFLKNPNKGHDYPVPPASGPKAIVLDIDDTTLNTYNYEIYSNFAYNPVSNAAFVNNAAFPAVFGMPALVSYAQSKGYTLLFLTGRPETQRPGTMTNLANAGYPSVPSTHLVLKDYTVDTWLTPCAPTCTTIQYKSLTRKHFEQDLGFHIVANFGDQYSDLTGGYAQKTFKLPNPMYYLP